MNSFYLGNKELLKWWKIGFLASRKIASPAVLPTLDWAAETSRRTDVAIVSRLFILLYIRKKFMKAQNKINFFADSQIKILLLQSNGKQNDCNFR